jgi:hypothetical protein
MTKKNKKSVKIKKYQKSPKIIFSDENSRKLLNNFP